MFKSLDGLESETVLYERWDMDRNILNYVQRRQLIWFGHISRMEKGLLLRKMLKWVPSERRLRGRLKLGRKDFIIEALMTRDLTENYSDDKSPTETEGGESEVVSDVEISK